MRYVNSILKRLMDVIGSFLGIIFLSLFLVAIAIVIKIDDKGPILFKQERIGKNGRTFRILKFRTMVIDAENIGDGLHVTSSQDNRITKIGRFLRATSLDELPQLFNVLIGDMSLVGPRPPVTYYPYSYEDYSEIQKVRFQMRPGITGLSQIKVRNSVSWDERIIFDIEYVKNFNVLWDVIILFNTFKRVFRPESIYDNRKEEKN